MSQNPHFQQEQQLNQAQQANAQQHPLANYQFSPEELRVLRECNRESFFQRSMPIGTGLGLGAWWAVKNGYLKPSPRFGPGPKVLLGITVGYFIGKFSYQSRCAEKLMKLPNSRLAEMLKQRRRGGIMENLTPDQGFGAGLSLSPFNSAVGDSYSDETARKGTPQSALDLDTYRPPANELDDTFRQSLDSPITYEDQIPDKPPKYQTTYEELRKKNREEYNQRQSSAFNRQPAAAAPPAPPPQSQVDDGPQEPVKSGRNNQYGDVWTS